MPDELQADALSDFSVYEERGETAPQTKCGEGGQRERENRGESMNACLLTILNLLPSIFLLFSSHFIIPLHATVSHFECRAS